MAVELSSGRVTAALLWGRVAGALLIALVLVAVAYVGYLVGTPDVNSDAVRLAATAEGREAGAEKGAKAGYTQGYELARERTYLPAYSAAYREAYAGEFERAGLEPPQGIRVPEPR